jgi:acyl carrier protein
MTVNGKVIQAIFNAVDEFNQQSPKGERLEKSVETVLYGESGKLDSLGLVSLIIAVEEKIEEEFGAAVTIADERAMSQVNSPFKSIGTLANYVTLLLAENVSG